MSGRSAAPNAGGVLPSHRQQQQQLPTLLNGAGNPLRGATQYRGNGAAAGGRLGGGPGSNGMGASSGMGNMSGNGSGNGGASSAVKRNLTRAKTLTRPDRHITPAPLINPHKAPGASAAPGGVLTSRTEKTWWQPWTFYIYAVTFWAPGALLAACGMKEKAKQRAWKEKVALCSIAIIMGGFIGFATIGLQRTLCPQDATSSPGEFIRLGEQSGEDVSQDLAATSPGWDTRLRRIRIAPQAWSASKGGCSMHQEPTTQSTASTSRRCHSSCPDRT